MDDQGDDDERHERTERPVYRSSYVRVLFIGDVGDFHDLIAVVVSPVALPHRIRIILISHTVQLVFSGDMPEVNPALVRVPPGPWPDSPDNKSDGNSRRDAAEEAERDQPQADVPVVGGLVEVLDGAQISPKTSVIY